jgi:hypothetical protein
MRHPWVGYDANLLAGEMQRRVMDTAIGFWCETY